MDQPWLELELFLVKLAKHSSEPVFDSMLQKILAKSAGLFVSWHQLLEHSHWPLQKLLGLHQPCAEPWFDDQWPSSEPQHQASPS